METKKTTDQESIRVANEKLVRSWSSVKYIVEDLDSLADKIKEETGSHCDRSKLLNALAEIVVECQQHLDISHIKNHETLKDALIKALKKHK